MKTGEKLVVISLIVVGLAVAILPSVLHSPRGGDGSVPVGKVFAAQAVGYAKVFEDAASEVGKSIKTDADLLAFVEPKTAAVRKSAFGEIDTFVEQRLPRDVNVLKPESSDFLRMIAEAFRTEANR